MIAPSLQEILERPSSISSLILVPLIYPAFAMILESSQEQQTITWFPQGLKIADGLALVGADLPRVLKLIPRLAADVVES